MRLRENEISFAYLKNNRRRFKNAIACFTFFLVHNRRLELKLVLVYYFFQTEKIGRFKKTGLVSGGPRPLKRKKPKI